MGSNVHLAREKKLEKGAHHQSKQDGLQDSKVLTTLHSMFGPIQAKPCAWDGCTLARHNLWTPLMRTGAAGYRARHPELGAYKYVGVVLRQHGLGAFVPFHGGCRSGGQHSPAAPDDDERQSCKRNQHSRNDAANCPT